MCVLPYVLGAAGLFVASAEHATFAMQATSMLVGTALFLGSVIWGLRHN